MKENELNEKNQKNKKMMKKKKMKKFGFTRKILDDLQDFVSECVFPEEKQQPVMGVIVFPKKSDNFHWT